VTAAVAGLGAALAAPLAAAGGGLTLFGIIAGVAVKRTKDQIKEIDDLQQKAVEARDAILGTTGATRKTAIAEAAEATQAYKQALNQLSPAQERFMNAQARMSGAFDKLMKAAGPAIFGPLVQGMNLLSKVMPKLAPLLGVVAGALTNVLQQVSQAVSGGAFSSFLDFFQRYAGPAIQSFAAIMANLASGVFGFIQAFAPFGTSLLGGIVRLSAGFAEFGRTVGSSSGFRGFIDYVQRIGPMVVAFFRELIGAGVNLVRALAPIGTVVLAGLTGLFRLIRRIPIDVLTSMLAGAVVTLVAFKVAMIGVNIAMRANPIGLIVTALGLLAAGLVLAYKKSETFRAIVKGVFEAVGTIVRVWWNGWVKPIFAAVKWYIVNVLAPVFRWIKNNIIVPIFTAAFRTIRRWWNQNVKPVLGAFVRYINGTLAPAIRELHEKTVKPTFNKMGRAIDQFWRDGAKPTLSAMTWYHRNVLGPVIRAWYDKVVKPSFRAAGRIIATWWNGVKAIFQAVIGFIRNQLAPGIRWLWEKGVKPTFNFIANNIASKWNRQIKPVFQAMGNFVTKTLPNAFRKGIDKIGQIWNSLKRLAAVPVRFILETIYEKGIRKLVNNALDFFDPGDNKGPRLPPAPNINWGKKAKGGVLPGYTPGRDVHHFRSPTGGTLHLSGGEAVMRPEWTRAVGGPKAVDSMNREAANMPQHGPLPRRRNRFFFGGVMPTRAASVSSHGSGYYGATWAGDINGPGEDKGQSVKAWKNGIVALVAHLNDSYGNHIRINHPQDNQQSLYAHLMSTAVQGGQSVRAGQHIGRLGSSGNSTGPHLHFEIDGGLGNVSQGSGGGGGGFSLPSLPSWLTALPETIADLIGGFGDKFKGAGMFAKEIVGGAAEMMVDKAKSFITEKLASAASFLGVGSAKDFGPGADGIWRSLMSTGFYSPKQAAGVMGNMVTESGLVHNIVQGGGRKELPTGVSSGWGLVQWTPGTKVLPYLNGDGSVGSQIGALTAQLRGKGSSPEGAAGAKLRATNSVSGATYAFGKYYERPADLGSTIAKRRSDAQGIYERFAGKARDLGRAADPRVNPTLSDNGGWLHPLQTTTNKTRKPEPVFSNSQWQILKRAITAVTMNQGRPINANWLRGLTRDVPKSADQLRREFLRLRDVLRPIRVRTERAQRRLKRIRASDRFQRRDEVRDAAMKAFDATRSGEEIGEDVSQTRRDRARALRRARRSPMGRDALREYREASRKLEKLRTSDVVEEATKRTKWRLQEARDALKNANAPVRAAREDLKKAQDDAEKAKTKQDKAEARRAVRRAREELERARKQPDSARKREAREDAKRAKRRLDNLNEEQSEIDKLTKQRDRAGSQSEAVKDLVAATKRLEALREERKERQKLRREARKAGRADILVREERAQERLNKRIDAEKKAMDAAKKAAQAYRAAQQAAIERARTLTTTGIELGGIGAAPFKTSGGIVSNLRRSVRAVTQWGQVVKALIGRGLKGPILEEFIDAGPSEEAVRMGKSLLAGTQIAEINALQNQLRTASTNAAAVASASYTPAQRAAIRRATPVKYQPSNAQNKMSELHTHVHGMPADTAAMIAQKAADRLRYMQDREGVA